MYELSGETSVGNFGWAGVVGDENLDGPRSIAVPGAVAGLCEAHRMLGRLPLRDVVAPAVSLARDGHSPGWHSMYSLGLSAPRLFEFAELRSIFMPDGKFPAGDLTTPALLRQPGLADVLEAIGRDGPAAFYSGDIARAITSDIRASGGIVSEQDFAEYRPFVWERGPGVRLLGAHRAGAAVRVRGHDLGDDPAGAGRLRREGDGPQLSRRAARLHLGCAPGVRRPVRVHGGPGLRRRAVGGLVSDGYTDMRRGLIDPGRLGDIEPGDPWAFDPGEPGDKMPGSLPALDSGTTHLCAMDSEGNAVSLTNTLMGGFGSGFVPKGTGVVMNNGMMWFDPVPGRVNSIKPGKYPLNNMTPALVMGPDGVRMAVGASGGRRITNCVTQLISKVVDFGIGPQEAIDSPRVDCSLAVTSVDPRMDAGVVGELEGRGHRIYVIGDDHVQGGFAGFASPVAITRDGDSGFRAGVDTFHSAYAAEGV